MEPKKISFGFSKVIKKPNLLQSKPKEVENTVELIKCLEGQSIQLVKEQDVEEKPLVIPMKDSRKTSAALASLKLRQQVLTGNLNDAGEEKKEEKPPQPPQVHQEQNIEQKAVLELLKEARGENSEEEKDSSLTLPLKPDELPLDGAIEPTLEDYDSIPISQFGLAMLRGMGWKEQENKKATKDEEGPVLRPKGMGLGADKVLKRKALLVAPEANEKLEIKKNACVRILGGKYKDMYGQIEGLDDHAGRVIVKLALGGNRESLNEFMVQPVSKREYTEFGKVINSAKYEQYKKMENEYGQIVIKVEDIKTESDVSIEGDGKNKSGKSLQHSTVSDDDVFKSSARYNSRIDSDISELKVKNENKERNRDKITASRSSKYPSHASNERSELRKESPQNDQSHTRRDHRSSRRQSASEEESSDSEDYRKSKKKSKKKSKDRHRYRHDSSEDDKRHKKKTKKSKRPRSRSRQRR